SHRTCLPASAAAIVGSACSALGPPLSTRPIAGSLTRSRQSVVERSYPYRRAAAATASSLRPASATRRGTSGGGHVMYTTFRNAFECAFPMNAYPSMPTPISCSSPAAAVSGAAPIPACLCPAIVGHRYYADGKRRTRRACERRSEVGNHVDG